MSRKVASLFVVAILAVASVLLIARSGRAQAPAAKAPVGFTPVMSLHSLMIEQDRHFESVVDLIRSGNGKERFVDMEHEAMALAEMGNINGYHKGSSEHDDYRGWAGQLKNLSIELALHAKSKNADAARETAKQISATCKACHNKYR